MASNSFEEALIASAENRKSTQDTSNDNGPWDDLVGWYWGLWDEYDAGMSVDQGTNQDFHGSLESVLSYPDSAEAHSILEHPKNHMDGQHLLDLGPMGLEAIGVNALIQEDDLGLPLKSFRDEIVSLFFKHVHPICPVFDEVEFYNAYYNGAEDLSILQNLTLVEFKALLFAGSLHLDQEQISQTKYSSTINCHEALFETARSSYHAASSNEPPISLTRAAILLSFWSPFSSEKQVNNYWVDQAYINARSAILEELDDAAVVISPGRKKIIWWCCQLRDAMISFALRRIDCLHTDPLVKSMICVDDFGMESTNPCWMSQLSKLLLINNFVRQCELGQVMSQIMLFQKQQGYTRFYDRCRLIDANEILKVASFHSEVREFREDFEMSIDISQRVLAERYDMPCHMSRIITDSVIAMLYFPYMALDPSKDDLPASRFIEGAISEVMEAASRIAKSADSLLSYPVSNGIPLSLGAWVIFPIILKLILLGNNTSRSSNLFPELEEMRNLMGVLYILKYRFSGGQFVSNVIDAVIKRVNESAGVSNERRMPLSLLQDAAKLIQRDVDREIITNG